MVALHAMHGRARLARAKRGRAVLVVLLLAAIAVLALAQLADIGAAQAARETGWTFTARQIGALGAPIVCVVPLVAGMLIDRYGLRRIVALALVFWCGAISLGASALPPIALALVAPLAFDLLHGTLLTAALVALRLALAKRRRAPATAVVIVAYGFAPTPSFALYRDTLGGFDPRTALLALVTCGSLVVAAWLFSVREISPTTDLDLRPSRQPPGALLRGIDDIASRLILWRLLAIQLCYSVVFALIFDRYWTLELVQASAIGSEILVPVVATPIATLVAAGWSDWSLRRTRSMSRSRQPFVVLGFIAAAVAALATTQAHQSPAGLALLGAAGIGAIRMIDVLAVDLAPRAAAGRFLGLLGAGEAVLSVYIMPIVESIAEEPRTRLPLLTAASVVGAGLALVLLRRLPEAPAS